MTAIAETRENPGSREQLLGLSVLLLCILLSAFAVISTTHSCRELYSSLQELESAQWSLQEDYGRLVLEQSVWSSHYRVEKVARTELGMGEPDLTRFEVMAP